MARLQQLTRLAWLTAILASYSPQTFASSVPGKNACVPLKNVQTPDNAPIKLRFVGDLVLGNAFLVEDIPDSWDEIYFSGVEPYLKDASVTVANLEGVLSDGGETLKETHEGRSFAFRFPKKYGTLLKHKGISVVNIANNHSYDFGEQGYFDTITNLKASAITVVGIKHKIAYKTVSNVKIAFVGFSFYAFSNQIQKLKQARHLIQRARQNAQYVVVTFHGGAEGWKAMQHPNSTEIFLGENRGNTVAFARAAIDAGADLVVGHGPHVLRAIECYKDKPIFYSLGNFIGVGGLYSGGFSSLSMIAGVNLNAKGVATSLRILPLRMRQNKTPKVDTRGYSNFLINYLNQNALYKGDFISAPISAKYSAQKFARWFAAIKRREEKRDAAKEAAQQETKKLSQESSK